MKNNNENDVQDRGEARGSQNECWRWSEKHWRFRTKQKRRAVASLQTRKRVVASLEDRDCGQSMVLYMPRALRSVRSKLWPSSNQLKRSSQNLRAVPLSFAQLAIGCSNPSFVIFTFLAFPTNIPSSEAKPDFKSESYIPEYNSS